MGFLGATILRYVANYYLRLHGRPVSKTVYSTELFFADEFHLIWAIFRNGDAHNCFGRKFTESRLTAGISLRYIYTTRKRDFALIRRIRAVNTNQTSGAK